MPYNIDPSEYGGTPRPHEPNNQSYPNNLEDTQKFDTSGGFGTRTPSGTVPPEEPLPPSRSRPMTGCLRGLLYFLFVVGISTLLAAVGWVAANDALGLMKEDHEATVRIPENYTISQVAEILKEAQIIENPFFFKIYAGFSKADEKIDSGTYILNAKLDYRALVYAMRKGSDYRPIIRVTIPEGYEQRQIVDLLVEKGVAKREELENSLQYTDFSYDYIKTLPKTATRLEGYLFPDTYDFYVGEDPDSAIGKLLNNFNRKYTADMRARTEDLGLTIQEAVTIASIIEREQAAGADEGALISSVIYNRLEADMLLGMDSTIQYVTPPEERKLILTYEDTQVSNPYNTYMYKGLPPGPIANPGLEALQAALYPESTKYLYFALTTEGVHQFSKTLAEHEKVLAENREVYEP